MHARHGKHLPRGLEDVSGERRDLLPREVAVEGWNIRKVGEDGGIVEHVAGPAVQGLGRAVGGAQPLHERFPVGLEAGGLGRAPPDEELDLLVDHPPCERIVVPVDAAGDLQVRGAAAHRQPDDHPVDRLAFAEAKALVEPAVQQVAHEERGEQFLGRGIEELVPGPVADGAPEIPPVCDLPAPGVRDGEPPSLDGAGGEGPEGAFGGRQRPVAVQVAHDGHGHCAGGVVAVVESAQIVGGDPPEALPVVGVGAAPPFDAELPFPEAGPDQPGRVEGGPQVAEELAGAGIHLVLDRLPPAFHHLRVHGVGRQDAGQPLDGEEAVLPRDRHVVPGVVGEGEAVELPAEALDRVLDLLLGAALAVREEHVFGEVRELLPAGRVGVGTDGDAGADRDVGRPGEVLEPDLDPVGQVMGLEVGEGVGSDRVPRRGGRPAGLPGLGPRDRGRHGGRDGRRDGGRDGGRGRVHGGQGGGWRA